MKERYIAIAPHFSGIEGVLADTNWEPYFGGMTKEQFKYAVERDCHRDGLNPDEIKILTVSKEEPLEEKT